MRTFIVLLTSILLTGAVSVGGVGTAINRSVISPDFYTHVVNKTDLPGLLGTFLEKISGKNQITQVTRLAISHIEPEIRKQTGTIIEKFFLYLRGKESVFKFSFDISILQKDTAFVNIVLNNLIKNEKLRSASDFLMKPIAQQLVSKLPTEIDLQKLTGIKEKNLTGLRSVTMHWLPKFDMYYIITWGFISVLIIVILLLLRSFRKSALFIGFSMLTAGILLCIPWLYSDYFFTGLKNPVIQMLRDTNIMKIFTAELISVYMISPIVCLSSGIIMIITGFFLKKEQAS
jgi:hypothetical protein